MAVPEETTTPDEQRVAIGQIWADNDWRSKGRTVRIIDIGATRVTVETVTAVGGGPTLRPTKTRILRNRFRPISTGYILVSDSE